MSHGCVSPCLQARISLAGLRILAQPHTLTALINVRETATCFTHTIATAVTIIATATHIIAGAVHIIAATAFAQVNVVAVTRQTDRILTTT